MRAPAALKWNLKICNWSAKKKKSRGKTAQEFVFLLQLGEAFIFFLLFRESVLSVCVCVPVEHVNKRGWKRMWPKHLVCVGMRW